ncbi:hypothetical protein ACLOJK_022706 [Asimina triloba]
MNSTNDDDSKGSPGICGRKIQRAGARDEGMGVGLGRGMKGEGELSSYGGTPVGVESRVENAFVGGSVTRGRKIPRQGREMKEWGWASGEG